MAYISKRNRRQEKERRSAAKNRREIIAAGLSRREMMKMGLLTSAGMLIPVRGLSARARNSAGHLALEDCESPPTQPFPPNWELPTHMNGLMPIKQALPGPTFTVGGAPMQNPIAGEGRTRPHQAFTQFPPQKYYEVHQRRELVNMHPDLPLQPIWGFDGISPGPTYVAYYNEPILVRNINDLPADNEGFGIAQVSTHLHNGHTPSESDGFPCDYFPNPSIGLPNARFYDQHYPNVLAGFQSTHPPNGDFNESMSTLWYHDHRVEFTAQNVYKGLAGFYLLFNRTQHDTGNELTGFRLPSHPFFDIPLILTDKVFDQETQLLCFDLFNDDGILGDKFLVNGRINPTFNVQPRRYRFRVLDGGPSRFYQVFLTNLNALGTTNKFWHIANDGNLLPRPVEVSSIRLGVAERMDIIIDFSLHAGKTLYLENRLQQTDGRGAMGNNLRPAGQGDRLLKFVVASGTADDGSLHPSQQTFFALPDKTEQPRITRTFRFERTNGQWAINQKLMPGDCNDVRFLVTRGRQGVPSVERWILQNNSGGWQHPIHIHFEEFQIIQRTRSPETNPIPHSEASRKDVLLLRDNEQVEIFFRFRDFSGRYPMHCHNTIHEDHAMMLRFDIAEQGDNKTNP